MNADKRSSEPETWIRAFFENVPVAAELIAGSAERLRQLAGDGTYGAFADPLIHEIMSTEPNAAATLLREARSCEELAIELRRFRLALIRRSKRLPAQRAAEHHEMQLISDQSSHPEPVFRRKPMSIRFRPGGRIPVTLTNFNSEGSAQPTFYLCNISGAQAMDLADLFDGLKKTASGREGIKSAFDALRKILIGWENLNDEDGQPIGFDVAIIEHIFTMQQLGDLIRACMAGNSLSEEQRGK